MHASAENWMRRTASPPPLLGIVCAASWRADNPQQYRRVMGKKKKKSGWGGEAHSYGEKTWVNWQASGFEIDAWEGAGAGGWRGSCGGACGSGAAGLDGWSSRGGGWVASECGKATAGRGRSCWRPSPLLRLRPLLLSSVALCTVTVLAAEGARSSVQVPAAKSKLTLTYTAFLLSRSQPIAWVSVLCSQRILEE